MVGIFFIKKDLNPLIGLKQKCIHFSLKDGEKPLCWFKLHLLRSPVRRERLAFKSLSSTRPSVPVHAITVCSLTQFKFSSRVLFKQDNPLLHLVSMTSPVGPLLCFLH